MRNNREEFLQKQNDYRIKRSTDYEELHRSCYRYVLFLTDIFSKIGWTVPLKDKNSRTIKELPRSNVELQNTLNALEEKVKNALV